MTEVALLVAIALSLAETSARPKSLPGRARQRRVVIDEAVRLRVIVMLMLVEVRSGSSVLAALQSTSERLPDDVNLRKVARFASVSGLVATLPICDDALRRVIAQLARAQGSGAPVAETIRRILDQDLARYRSSRLAKARALPVKLMIPVTLLMLPGLVLVLYAPSLIRTFVQLASSWS